ncbi:MAG: class I SAM-dependent methyltransferase [Clostridia bacterium]|nr:class I SAM-dependent methyltransferase [Clostridia bacterium]
MMLRTKLLLFCNRFFKAPVHPFNLQNEGVMTYAEWQFQKGEDTIALYLKKYTTEEMFRDKVVVDIGCGAAGKSLYYASCGAKEVIGVDILEKYREEAEGLAKKLDLQDHFRFIATDATRLPFEESSIDTIIMNDAMEHVEEPEAILTEALRVLKPGGRLYVNFPPYNHPFGAHLKDAIYIPWVHLFFSEKVQIEAYKHLVRPLPDGEERIKFRISAREDGTEYFSYLNHMSTKRFNRILKKLNLSPAYYSHEPLRPIFRAVRNWPVCNELFLKMVVCVLEK